MDSAVGAAGSAAAAGDKRPRAEDSGDETEVAVVSKSPRAPSVALTQWHYDFRNNTIWKLFQTGYVDGKRVVWCRLCLEGPYSLRNGGDGNLRAHLNGR